MTESPGAAGAYYEDVSVGETREFGAYEVTESEIVEFASKYDPQPAHVDPDAAADTFFDGLVASGWHTASMCMRMLVDGYLAESRAVGAVGADEVRWHRPVRPGDVLSVRTEVLEKRPWDGDVGLVRTAVEVLADDEVAMSMVGMVLFERRDDGADG